DEKGTDIWIGHKNGKKESQQCKGRNGSKDVWDFVTANAKDIFVNWKYHLDRDKLNTVTLVTPRPFPMLQDIIDRANNTTNNSRALSLGGYMDSFQQHIINSLIPIGIFIFSFGTMAFMNYKNGKATRNKKLIGLGIMYLIFLIGGLLIISVMFYQEYQDLAFDLAAELINGKSICCFQAS
ncbi:MAG: hypothetical protein L6276_03125, partial [Acetobacterium sp.]|nr:hypothetical protein [Bacillota bacterium]MCG2729261.1 hypothetical protein [Acetobacterium sp.]